MSTSSEQTRYSEALDKLRASISWTGDEAVDKPEWNRQVAEMLTQWANSGDNEASAAESAVSASSQRDAALGVYAWKMEETGSHYQALRAAMDFAGVAGPTKDTFQKRHGKTVGAAGKDAGNTIKNRAKRVIAWLNEKKY